MHRTLLAIAFLVLAASSRGEAKFIGVVKPLSELDGAATHEMTLIAQSYGTRWVPVVIPFDANRPVSDLVKAGTDFRVIRAKDEIGRFRVAEDAAFDPRPGVAAVKGTVHWTVEAGDIGIPPFLAVSLNISPANPTDEAPKDWKDAATRAAIDRVSFTFPFPRWKVEMVQTTAIPMSSLDEWILIAEIEARPKIGASQSIEHFLLAVAISTQTKEPVVILLWASSRPSDDPTPPPPGIVSTEYGEDGRSEVVIRPSLAGPDRMHVLRLAPSGGLWQVFPPETSD